MLLLKSNVFYTPILLKNVYLSFRLLRCYIFGEAVLHVRIRCLPWASLIPYTIHVMTQFILELSICFPISLVDYKL